VTQSPLMSRSPAHQAPAFGGINRTTAETTVSEGPDFAAIQASAEFIELKRRFRRFVVPVSVAFFVWYLSFVVLAAFDRDLMSRKVGGAVHLGLVLGLLQFATTIAITIGYLRYARRRIDPQVRAVRRGAGR
jgi:uncharacterized membrane protein (DUF485 family)